MKNWISIVEDGDSIVTAHFPMTRVRMVVESEDCFIIHLDKGLIRVKGAGVEKLLEKVLSEGQPVLKKATASIESVEFDRRS